MIAGGPVPFGVVLRALVVDDEEPARRDLTWLLERVSAIGDVAEASDGTVALKMLTATAESEPFGVVFLDISMPGLSGLDIARTISYFENPPAVVFVTAFDTPASDAFALGVLDYLRKPVSADRLGQAVQKVVAAQSISSQSPGVDPQPPRISVSAGTNRQVLLGPSDVTHFESCGDYVRVHTEEDSYLVRDTMTRLTEAWSNHGFVRIHRSSVVRISAVDEVRIGPDGRSVCVGNAELPVSRRYAPDLTARLSAGQRS